MLLPACLSALLASPASAEPVASCMSARAGAHVAAQPEAWRLAVEALLASTASPGQPWSCVGGEVDLVVGTSSTTLTVVDAQGNAVSREIASPDDVAPLGEALLSKPVVEPEMTTPLPKQEAKQEAKQEPDSTSLRDPRVLVAATAGPRYAGPAHFMWGSFGVLAAVPFRPWGGGIWIRYDGFSTTLDKPLPAIRDLCIGAAGYWSTTVGRVEIRPVLRPSLVVVTRRIVLNNDGPSLPDGPPRPPLVRDETEFDFRVGAEAQVVIGLTKKFRAVLGLDAEVSPGELVSTFEPHRTGDLKSRIPAYTMGLSVGIEVAVP